MRVITLFIAAVVVTQYEIAGVDTEMKGSFSNHQYGEKMENSNFAKQGGTETLTEEQQPSEEPHLDFSLSTSINYDSRMHCQSDNILAQRQAGQIFKGVGLNARLKRQVLKNYTIVNSTWNNGIFYTFNTSDQEVQASFKMGVKVWSDNTCIDFVEDKNAQDKVVVVKQDGCWSYTGQAGGDQLLSLDEDCLTEGSAVHEIGHVLGLIHTMSRYDRHNYVKIIKKNVDPRFTGNFAKVSRTKTEVYGLAYDYGSIMHYDELSCSGNNQPTVIARNPYYQKTMGSDLISFSDIFVVNEHHGCNAKCNKSTSAKCANEGFPHPRNCSTCICPSGYGGDLCDRRPPGCGDDLVATGTVQLHSSRLDHESRWRNQFDFCNYMIMAPEGKRIEVDVRSISRGYELSGCPVGGVEVKAQEDQKMTGYRFCSVEGSSGPIVSYSNRLPLILFSRYGSLQANFTYRSID